MKTSFRLPYYLAMGVSALSLAGCATLRPMPTHAGGKRFDEEERLLSATTYHAVGKMDFTSFKKRKIALEVTSLETSGAIEVPGFPGIITSIPIPIGEYFNIDYRLSSKLDVKSVITRQDIEYLEGVLEKRLRFDGFQVTSPADADIYLVVLVDSLGTNYNRDDYLIAYKDNIKISCEMTYYAVDAKTQKLISSSRSVASCGNYYEINYRPLTFRTHARNVADFTATIVAPSVSHKQSFNDSLGLAPVSDTQTVYSTNKKKKGKEGKKKNGRKTPRRKTNKPLPDVEGGDMLGSDLLPALDGGDTGEKPAADDEVKKLDKFTQWANKRVDGNDIQGAKKMIRNIRKLNPNAEVLEELEKRVKKMEEDNPSEKIPQSEGDEKSSDPAMPAEPASEPHPDPKVKPKAKTLKKLNQ